MQTILAKMNMNLRKEATETIPEFEKFETIN